MAAIIPTLSSSSPEEVTTSASELPLLPINLMLDEDPSDEGYTDWYRGTSWQHLCQSVLRIDSIKEWDPETCACVNPELELRSSERLRHARVHALNEREHLLGIERGWLIEEMVRKMRADLANGGSLLTSTPNTKEQMRRAMERASEEELSHLGLLLAMAQAETKQVAIEAELKAGRFRVDDQFLYG